MGDKTKIQWSDATWNPLAAFDRATGKRGWFCTRVSDGCKNCYAAILNQRLGTGHDYQLRYLEQIEFRLVNLDQPSRWKRPRRIFVNSMTDLFHEAVPSEMIVEVFVAMAMMVGRHVFQVLTKRAGRMADLLGDPDFRLEVETGIAQRLDGIHRGIKWPLPNVWLGTSVENQEAADDRIPHLLRTPAAVRFLSCEPLIGSVDLTRVSLGECDAVFHDYPHINRARFTINAVRGVESFRWPAVDWVIAGGESGPGARPCNVEWIRSIVAQCRNFEVPVFVKQLGARAVAFSGTMQADIDWTQLVCTDRKGGIPEEWPEDLRVREFPAAIRSAT